MKLYYSKGACSLAVRIVIHELNIPCEFEAVNLQTKRTESDADYLKINPKGAVPALQLENKEILTENSAIQQYLADHHKATHLLPPMGDFKRYRVIEWLGFINSDLHKGCSPLFNSKIPEEEKETIFKPALKSKLAILEKHFASHTFLMGDEFTLPDAYLLVILRWVVHFKIPLIERPHLARYFADLKKRKSIQQAMSEEGLS